MSVPTAMLATSAGGGLEQRSAAHLRPELLAGQQQEHDRRDVEAEPDHLADVSRIHDLAAGDARSTMFQPMAATM